MMPRISLLVSEVSKSKYSILGEIPNLDLQHKLVSPNFINIVDSDYFSKEQVIPAKLLNPNGLNILWISGTEFVVWLGKFTEKCLSSFDCIVCQSEYLQELIKIRHKTPYLLFNPKPAIHLSKNRSNNIISNLNVGNQSVRSLLIIHKSMTRNLNKIAILDEGATKIPYTLQYEIEDVFDEIIEPKDLQKKMANAWGYLSHSNIDTDPYILDALHNGAWCFANESPYYKGLPITKYGNVESANSIIKDRYVEFPRVSDVFSHNFVSSTYTLKNFQVQLMEIIRISIFDRSPDADPIRDATKPITRHTKSNRSGERTQGRISTVERIG